MAIENESMLDGQLHEFIRGFQADSIHQSIRTLKQSLLLCENSRDNENGRHWSNVQSLPGRLMAKSFASGVENVVANIVSYIRGVSSGLPFEGGIIDPTVAKLLQELKWQDTQTESIFLRSTSTSGSYSAFLGLVNDMRDVGLDGLLRDSIVRFAEEQISARLATVSGRGDRSLGLHLQWLCQFILPIARACPEVPPVLVQRLLQGFARRGCGQLFELIREYPASLPVLEELRVSLAHTGEHARAARAMKEQLASRLLIPGAHTQDILSMYLRTYKVVCQLHPRGSWSLFLEVTAPIIALIHRRADAVKCIVATMLEDHAVEAAPAPHSTLDEEPLDGGGDDYSAWVPAPLDTAARSSSAADTMSLLIGVYGSREMFLAEFREMLTRRLLQLNSFDVGREAASLDLMRARFGEEAMADCGVMLQDVESSRAVNEKIRGSSVSALILSRHFWPARLAASPVPEAVRPGEPDVVGGILPPEIDAQLEAYNAAFQRLKPMQSLTWRKMEGVMVVVVEVAGREVEVRASPVQVAALRLVASARARRTNSVTAEAAAHWLNLPADVARAALAFWVTKGVLREVDVNEFAEVE